MKVKFEIFTSINDLVEFINYHDCEVIAIDGMRLYYKSKYSI